MREIPLKPYFGTLLLCDSPKEFSKLFKKYMKKKPPNLETFGGMTQTICVRNDKTLYLVYADKPGFLAHELAHVIFSLFEQCGIDPFAANNEPFCYMLSHLIHECSDNA